VWAGTSSGRPEQGWFPNEARLVGMAPVFSLTSCRSDSDSAASRPIRSMGGTSVSPNGVGRSCGEDTSVTVPRQANIFGAAVDELPAPAGGGGGVPPIRVVVPAGTPAAVISHASGSLSFTALRAPDTHFHKCPGGREAILGNGPDGNPGLCPGGVPGGAIEAAGIVSGSRRRIAWATSSVCAYSRACPASHHHRPRTSKGATSSRGSCPCWRSSSS
jgi:hypothetical protein